MTKIFEHLPELITVAVFIIGAAVFIICALWGIAGGGVMASALLLGKVLDLNRSKAKAKMGGAGGEQRPSTKNA